MRSLITNAFVVIVALAIAVWVRPWRLIGPDGPPWTWVLAGAAIPLLWGLDHHVAVPIVQPMSGVVLFMLLVGWPLTILALMPIAVVTALIGDLSWVQALDRLILLGIVPATLALGLGAVVRRWLPNHLLVYIFARGFFGTLIVMCISSAAVLVLGHRPFEGADLIGSLLTSLAEAFVTGALTSSLVVFSPRLLATYSDRLYLPARTAPFDSSSSLR